MPDLGVFQLFIDFVNHRVETIDDGLLDISCRKVLAKRIKLRFEDIEWHV